MTLLVTAVLGGCGSSSSSSGPTKAAYAKSANSVCKSYQSKEQSLYSKLSSASSDKQAESYLSQAIAIGEKGVSKLEALAQPKSEKAQLASLFSTISKSVGDLKTVEMDLKSGKSTQARSELQGENQLATSIKADYNKLGLTGCANG